MAAIGRRPTFGGLVVGLVFWWQSLSPTLLPRSWAVQAAISAICATVGYALGTLGGRVVRAVLRRRGAHLPAAGWHRARFGLGALGALAVVVGPLRWLGWQNTQRDLVDMAHLSGIVVLPMLVLTVVLGAVLVTGGRVVGAAVRHLDRWNQRHLPRAAAQPLTIVLVLVLAVFALRDVAFGRFTDWASTTFGVVDTGTADGVVRPTAATVSGGAGSLVDWDDLGLQGRTFAAGATTTDELRAFWGDDAEVLEPIRAYAGLRSADDADDRAALAVDDLERAGGFERDVLVVATATGTGWIDPDAAEAVEQINQGDTAIVSMQYSYLPSWISFITDLDLAAEAGAELYDEVHRRWSELPDDDRPTLLVFGLSLGSFGAESAFAGVDGDTSLANLVARSDGALFVGPAHANPILRQLTEGRDAGSPEWAPVVDGGRTVRFVTRDPDQLEPDGPWGEPRVLYIQHPSDPVTHWGADWLWSRPGWMDSPRGYDVTDDGRWFPVVTWVQGVFDLMAGFAAPPGFGHDYRLDYVDGWVRVAPPEGWRAADTERLELFLFPDR
ncbi:MAG: alpha/beta-hydrolase family protein [Acidimicrobiales bacterium]|nr:alpha/beta-hydrolase family protein [Acidimicrobiales bacterium]